MNRAALCILFAGTLAAFGLFSESIIQARRADLLFQIAREELFNYELSSRLLRVHSFTNSLDFSGEISVAVLESRVLNSHDRVHKDLRTLERLGLFISNGVRIVTLQPAVRLQADALLLTRLQYAFHLERERHYQLAAQVYGDMIDEARASSRERAFALLHQGFCFFARGDYPAALGPLRRVQREHPYDPAAEDAQILERLIALRRTQETRLTQDADPAKAGEKLYAAGHHAAAVRLFQKARTLRPAQKLQYARSLENSGQKDAAAALYLELTHDTPNRAVARAANRRLLLLGTFYGGGEDLRQASEKRARALNDDEALKGVADGKREWSAPRVLQKLQELENQNRAAEQPPELSALLRIQRSVQTESARAQTERRESVSELSMASEQKVPLFVRLADGRRLESVELKHLPDGLQILRSTYTLQISEQALSAITVDGPHAELRVRLRDGREKGGRSLVTENGRLRLHGARDSTTLNWNQIASIHAVTP